MGLPGVPLVSLWSPCKTFPKTIPGTAPAALARLRDAPAPEEGGGGSEGVWAEVGGVQRRTSLEPQSGLLGSFFDPLSEKHVPRAGRYMFLGEPWNLSLSWGSERMRHPGWRLPMSRAHTRTYDLVATFGLRTRTLFLSLKLCHAPSRWVP